VKGKPVFHLGNNVDDVYWDPNDEIIQQILKDGIKTGNLTKKQKHLLCELNRRLNQMWHKVTSERIEKH